MMKHPKRRKPGRPKRDYSDDPDLLVAEFAITLQAAWDFSERKAFDWALAVFQSEAGEPSKIPHGAKVGVLTVHHQARQAAP